MRVGVMGAGAVGGYFGGVLARAGHQVVLVARRAHLEAIQEQGLTVKSHLLGEFRVLTEATADPSQLGEVDLILFTVKTYHNQQVIPLLKPVVGRKTWVLTLQNGVESAEQLSDLLPGNRVLSGAAYIEASVESPGVIVQKGEVARIVLGSETEQSRSAASRIVDLLSGAGIESEFSSDIKKVLWSKFIFIVALAGPTAAARTKMDRLLSYSEGQQLVRGVLREAERVAHALGITLDEDAFERTLSYIEGYARDLRASMHADLERGNPLELEALNGALVRMGRDKGVPVPFNLCIYALLKPFLKGRS